LHGGGVDEQPPFLGVATTAVARSESSAATLLRRLEEDNVAAPPTTVIADLDLDDLGWGEGGGPVVTEVYNLAGAYAFGMTMEQARVAHVDTTESSRARSRVRLGAVGPGPAGARRRSVVIAPESGRLLP
jgi:hypothetical protein